MKTMMEEKTAGNEEYLIDAPRQGLCAHINLARSQVPVLQECVEQLKALHDRINGGSPQEALGEDERPDPDGISNDMFMIAADIAELSAHIRCLVAEIHESL